MKKVVRTVWIGILSGLAFLTACACHKNTTQDDLMKEQRRHELQEQLDQLTQAIQRREGACVYGSPEVIQQFGEETRRMKQEAEEIRKQLDELNNDPCKK